MVLPTSLESLLSSFERFPELLSEQVEKVRDRTAEAVSSEGPSVLRELHKLRTAFDDLGDDVRGRIGAVEESLDDVADLLHTEHGNATTWPRRVFWLAVGTGIGVGIGYLTDPDRGQDRRAHLVDTAQTRADEVAREASTRAHDVKEQIQTSAQRVGDEAQRATSDVADEARDAALDVRDQAQDSAERLADEAQPNR